MNLDMQKYVMFLKPYISETIWGGRKLIKDYNISTDKANAAEAWMLSAHSDGPGTIINGCFAGQTFDRIVNNNPSLLGKHAKTFSRFPILIKFIDAMDNLSIQVHPTDEYCKKTNKGESKTECWYIIDCDEGAGLYLGFKGAISPEEFKKAIENNTLEERIEFIPVKKGDFFFIESGTLHAICKGILLAEVQESSNTTYRIYDYGRLGKDGKPRQLHIDDAVNVTSLVKFNQPSYARHDTNYTPGKNLLAKSDYFTVSLCIINDYFTGFANELSFVSLLVIDGEGSLECLNEKYNLKKGDSIFIPAGSGEFKITGKLQILETEI
ncbi:MAG: class I mannose-6-phosphate isomerase [Clostridiales bacterium]|nr:class I mannose-6-phosphate isomerase [Clostridiales bacterium]